jgi:hypothetical protein
MADGTGYQYNSGKYVWEICSSKIDILNKIHKDLCVIEPDHDFVIDKMEKFYKLSTKGKTRFLSQKYQQILYDKNKNKIVPYVILNSTTELKRAFFDGYYTGDGSKSESSCLRMDCKGKSGAQGLYFLMKSLGYNVSINTRENMPDIFRLNATRRRQKKDASSVKKIIEIGVCDDYVYDIETEEGIFHAGIGEMIVKNTDSNYITFPNLNTAQECWDYSVHVANEVTKLYPKPMALAFEEKIYWRFMLLTKKRYMSLACEKDGVVDTKISKKGVLLQRRDNCNFVRSIYEKVVMMVFDLKNIDDILYFIIQECNKLMCGYFPYTDFSITKSIGDIGDLIPKESMEEGKKVYKVGDYKITGTKVLPIHFHGTDEKEAREETTKMLSDTDCENPEEYYLKLLGAHIQLAEKIRGRGQLISSGSRIEYLITTEGGLNAKQCIKCESSEYFGHHKSVLRVDYLYYLNQLINPMDQIIDIIDHDPQSKYVRVKDFMLNLYKSHVLKYKMVKSFKDMLKPKMTYIE